MYPNPHTNLLPPPPPSPLPHPHLARVPAGASVPCRFVRLRAGAELDGVLHRPPPRDARGVPRAQAQGAVHDPLHQPGGVQGVCCVLCVEICCLFFFFKPVTVCCEKKNNPCHLITESWKMENRKDAR